MTWIKLKLNGLKFTGKLSQDYHFKVWAKNDGLSIINEVKVRNGLRSTAKATTAVFEEMKRAALGTLRGAIDFEVQSYQQVPGKLVARAGKTLPTTKSGGGHRIVAIPCAFVHQFASTQLTSRLDSADGFNSLLAYDYFVERFKTELATCLSSASLSPYKWLQSSDKYLVAVDNEYRWHESIPKGHYFLTEEKPSPFKWGAMNKGIKDLSTDFGFYSKQEKTAILANIQQALDS